MDKKIDKKKDLKKINPKGFDPKKYVDIEPKYSDHLMNEKSMFRKKMKEEILKGTNNMDEDLEAQLDEKVTTLDFMQRLKRSMVMKRYKGKIAAARKRAQKRRASPEKIKDRARKRALSLLRARLSRAKSYGDMTASEKNALDQRLSRIPASVINRIATKQIPVVKKIEMDRMSSKHESIDEAFENFIRESDEVVESIGLRQKPLKRFHRLFNNNGKVHHDLRFKMYKPKNIVRESSEVLSEEIYDLMEDTEAFVEACWKGYQQFGMKKKGNRKVPNCIPVDEGQALDMAKGAIEREKEADKVKHKSMLDNARKVDNRRKSIRNESNEIIDRIIAREKKHLENHSALKDFIDVANKVNSSDYLYHAAKIVKSHDMSISPQDLVNLYNRIHNAKDYEKSYVVFDAWESVDKNNPANREYGTDSLVKILKSDTPGEKLNNKFESFLEGSARGFEGKMIDFPNVPVRLANGKIKSLPSGKSSSSKGGDAS